MEKKDRMGMKKAKRRGEKAKDGRRQRKERKKQRMNFFKY